MPDLTFRELAEKSLSRRDRWHHADTIEWTGADWSNAMCGEAGEAANVVKKIRRHETGMPDVLTMTELRGKLADELGDVVAYLVLLAHHYDIDLGKAVADKFNRVSYREGYPERLTVPEDDDDDPACGYCGRDNRNGTHDALQRTGHLAHPFDPSIGSSTKGRGPR